jgi:hypothetical protein
MQSLAECLDHLIALRENGFILRPKHICALVRNIRDIDAIANALVLTEAVSMTEKLFLQLMHLAYIGKMEWLNDCLSAIPKRYFSLSLPLLEAIMQNINNEELPAIFAWLSQHQQLSTEASFLAAIRLPLTMEAVTRLAARGDVDLTPQELANVVQAPAAFMLGTHPRVGGRSAIFRFFGAQDGAPLEKISDPSVLRTVFRFL